MLLTPVLRGAFDAVSLHFVKAPQSGTGKSYLADIASMIATGDRCASKTAAPNNLEETEKRLVASALSGHPIIALDN